MVSPDSSWRNWLRAQANAGHPLLASHQHYARWEFTRTEADRLMAEFGAARDAGGAGARREDERKPRRRRAANERPEAPADYPLSDDPGHRVIEEWMGEQVVTLADLLEGLIPTTTARRFAPGKQP